jgi:opine dehydrogenase
MLQITVCGDSPIAHSVAAACSLQGHRVRVLCQDPALWGGTLRVCMPEGGRFLARIEMITSEEARAIERTDIVFVCVPHMQIEDQLRRIAPHLRAQMLVGGVPGFGGFGLLARALLPIECCIFGTQRIPFVVRHCVRGASVRIGGVRRQTFVGTLPTARARHVAELLAVALGVRTVPVSHYLNVELSPSNSIVNPSRLYALFSPLARRRPRTDEEFFADWDLSASHVLLAVDKELQEGRRRMPRDTSFVAPILLQYDANDAQMLTDQFRALSALGGRPIPVRHARQDAVELDLHSPYVLEDIDIGLTLVRGILELAGAATPQMDEILQWRASLDATIESRVPAPGPVRAFETIEALAAALD